MTPEAQPSRHVTGFEGEKAQPSEIDSGLDRETAALPIVFPPEEELQELLRLAKINSVTGIQDYMVRIQETAPRFIAFASKIEDLADNFDFAKIREIVTSYLKGGPE